MGQDRVGPSSKIWASRNNSGLSRINGSSLTRAVGVYGRLWDLREPEVPGRANDGATTATDVVLEGEHQSGRAVCVGACESLLSIAPVPGPLRGRATHAQNEAAKEFPSAFDLIFDFSASPMRPPCKRTTAVEFLDLGAPHILTTIQAWPRWRISRSKHDPSRAPVAN